MSEKKSDVTETCNQLLSVNFQLKAIQQRNAEILQHLAEAQAVAAEGDLSLPSHLTESITRAEDISKQVNETVDSQCDILKQSVQELRRLPIEEEESSSDGNSIQDQLRSQLNINVSLQKDKAELELDLAERLKLVDSSNDKNGQLQEDLQATQDSMQKLIESYEENTTKVEVHLKKLQDDLQRAQDKSREYDSLLERNSRNKSKKIIKVQSGSNAPGITTAAVAHASSSLPNPSDIDDRYMSLVEDNRRQRDEIQRLKAENTYLIKKNKQATLDMDTMQKHVATCTAQRQEMQIRLKRQQEEHQKLTKSMTKQAADWINEKKTIKDTENNTKLKKIGAI